MTSVEDFPLSIKVFLTVCMTIVVDVFFIGHALVTSNYEMLPIILGTSIAGITLLILGALMFTVMHAQLAQSTPFCSATVLVCSILGVFCGYFFAILAAAQDKLYNIGKEAMNLSNDFYEEFSWNLNCSLAAVLLLLFLQYWRTAAKIALRVREPFQLERPPLDYKSILTILAILTTKALIAFYYCHADSPPFVPLTIGFMTIAILFFMLTDVLDNIGVSLALSNHIILRFLYICMMSIVVVEVVVQLGWREYYNEDFISRTNSRVVMVTQVFILLLVIHFKLAQGEQEAKLKAAIASILSSEEFKSLSEDQMKEFDILKEK